ncbi:MAG: hypothetical protein GVY18_04555 [Bacteroidetes bacterium]|jgi:hypothetical protein|nr:hypothetical protein [Bacteroidota bacterium]
MTDRPGPILDERKLRAYLDRRFERIQAASEHSLDRKTHHIAALIDALTDCARHVRADQVPTTTRDMLTLCDRVLWDDEDARRAHLRRLEQEVTRELMQEVQS